MTGKSAKQPKRPLDYPEQTHGSRVAARGRKQANAMTEEEREENFKQAMAAIYGGAVPQKTGT